MKIALVRRDFRRHRGGGERYGLMVAEGLVAAGHEVHLFASRVDETLPAGVVHHPVPSLEFWSPLRHWSFERSVARRVDPAQFDVVQALQPHAHCDIQQAGDGLHRAWLALPEARSSWLSPQHPIKLQIERRAFRPEARTRIAVPSELVKRQAMQLYGVPSHRIDVIEPPIDWRRFAAIGEVDRKARQRRFGIPRDAVCLCFAGMNFRRKGLATLLAALERLDARFHLLVVGRDRRSWSYRRRVRRAGLAGRVRFVGAIDSIEEVLALCDALVLPALYEPFGMVLSEAMAAGRPVVASRSTGAAEWIRHGDNGLVLEDPRDPEELAGLLARLADPTARAAMGRRAAESVRHRTEQQHLERLLALYGQVAREGARRRGEAGAPLELERVGRVEAVRALAAPLRAAGLLDHAALAALPAERTLHAARPGRRVDRVRIGGRAAVRKLHARRRDGRGEWRALLALAEAGLAGPEPLAFAASRAGAALLMEPVEGERQLDHWLADGLPRLAPGERRHLKRQLTRTLAERVRAFHGAGFTHRDLYLCHVWLRESDGRLRFMDLHRVVRRRRPARRLRRKDLAALHYSAVGCGLSRSDAMRFFKRYLDVERLGPAQRRLARRILRKSARIARHDRPSAAAP